MSRKERKTDYHRLLPHRRYEAYKILNLPVSMGGGSALFVEFFGQGRLPDGILATIGVGLLGLSAYMNTKLIQHGKALQRLKNRNTEPPFVLPSRN